MNPLEHRILVLAPTGRDAEIACMVLGKAGFEAQACGNLEAVAEDLEQGASALMLAEEGISAQGMAALTAILSDQPPWSDIPIVVLTSAGEMSEARLRSLNAFSPSGNVTFLERPFRQMTLISTLKMAMRARERQYQLRRTLSSLGESEERLRLALDSGKIGHRDAAGSGLLCELETSATAVAATTQANMPATTMRFTRRRLDRAGNRGYCSGDPEAPKRLVSPSGSLPSRPT